MIISIVNHTNGKLTDEAVQVAVRAVNRQIAHELVVTVKAVEWHLSHVYRKLGIGSRTLLAETLGVPERVA